MVDSMDEHRVLEDLLSAGIEVMPPEKAELDGLYSGKSILDGHSITERAGLKESRLAIRIVVSEGFRDYLTVTIIRQHLNIFSIDARRFPVGVLLIFRERKIRRSYKAEL